MSLSRQANVLFLTLILAASIHAQVNTTIGLPTVTRSATNSNEGPQRPIVIESTIEQTKEDDEAHIEILYIGEATIVESDELDEDVEELTTPGESRLSDGGELTR